MHSPTKSEAPAIAPHVSDRIRACLDAFVNREYDGDVLVAELVNVCEEYPDASWEVLALLDQYHRRGQLTAETYETVKAAANKLIFGPPASDATLELSGPHEGLRPTPQPLATDDSEPEEHTRDDTMLIGPPRIEPRIEPRIAPRIEERPPRAAAPPQLTPGRVLRNRYVLQEPIGRGGMSMLFKALDRHREGLPEAERYVAIKFLRDEYTMRPEAVVALQDEFYQAQLLSHPNVIKVFDLDHDGDLHFVTMELLEGELLSQCIARMQPRLMPMPQALAIIREVGDALAYAHERGVVHADLKPANIMVTTAGRIRVLDFGLSSRLAADSPAADSVRPSRLHAATPAYASPERYAGREPDPRDDIFSLACIAYELFSGKRPFDDGPASAVRRHRPRRIPRLTARQWRTLRKGLAGTRHRRPRTVRDWLEGLDLHQAADDLLPRPAWQESARRPLWPAVASAIVLIGAVTAYLVIAENSPLRDQPAAVAAREFTRATYAALADRIAAVNRSSQVSAPATIDEASTSPAGADGASQEPQPAAPAEDATAGERSDSKVESLARAEPAAPQADNAAGAQSAPASAARPVQRPSPDPELAARKESSQAMRGPGVLSFTQDSYTVGESGTAARVSVQRMAGADGEIGFRWRTEAASATPEEDFGSFEDATESLAAGQQTAVLYVPIVSDTLRENTELFHVVIDDPRGGASLGPITRATVIIVDDD